MSAFTLTLQTSAENSLNMFYCIVQQDCTSHRKHEKLQSSRECIPFPPCLCILGDCLPITVLCLNSSDVDSPKIMFYTSFMILELFESKTQKLSFKFKLSFVFFLKPNEF